MKIYLASRFGNRAMLRKVGETLTEQGHVITSRWTLTTEARPDGKALVAFWAKWAVYDVEDLDACDALVLCTIGCDGADQPRGGMRFEEGYCYAQKKPIIVVGPRIIVFDQLKDIHYCDTWDECYKVLKSLTR